MATAASLPRWSNDRLVGNQLLPCCVRKSFSRSVTSATGTVNTSPVAEMVGQLSLKSISRIGSLIATEFRNIFLKAVTNPTLKINYFYNRCYSIWVFATVF